MTRQRQGHATDVTSPARSGSAAPANIDISTMTRADADAAPSDAAALEAAQEPEAAIRAIGLDGIVLGGATIRRMRRAAGLSSDALAGMIGYGRGLVWAWETGRRRCPPHMYLPLIEAISRARQDAALPGAHAHHDRFVASHRAA